MTETSLLSNATTIYVGFGSNMWKQQVKTRCRTAAYLGIARLPGYRWFIAAQGGANIAPGSGDDDDEVWGLAYSLQPEDEAELDVIERVPTHFTKNIIQAQLWEPMAADGAPADPARTGRLVGALVYISHERTATGKPRDEYVVRMNHAIADALSSGVPPSYVENVLRKWIPDGAQVGQIVG
ncbi:AIG2-like family protein [Cordyceps javanica]|uniref:gamma-glutamylcyclotransferase n=1 Tax=Cordyceps javanica TaxID=43265 RepID=A0A545VQA4_9HYPO|nr:AIG2-like family protein [Cordyceps javanica]TQW03918.1 AIG2-like family protein [Cordyceps javanica]